VANKTFIPAFRAKVGDWDYFICQMKYGEVARQVSFAYELGGNKDLSTMIQRGISDRTEDIKEYLVNSSHRFLGALIVAAWGGEPEYIPIKMDDPDGMLQGIDREFGVLTFDGTQQYFALDGQHRLRAIKDSIKVNPELLTEDICVLLVNHFESDEGRERTRRLFTNINRNAKSTTGAENIVLDEDDGIAILTRRFLTEHEFLKKDGIVRVFTRQGTEGDVRLAASSVAKTDSSAFTTLSVLNDMFRFLAFGLDPSMRKAEARPTPDVLEASYKVLNERIDELLSVCGKLRAQLEAAVSARDIRAPKDKEDEGHAFMRPVIQKAVCRVLSHIMDQQEMSWDEALNRLKALDWRIGQAPWTAVYSVEANKMVSGKDFTNLLDKLLLVHINPPSKQAIRDARKIYNELKGAKYPVRFEDLEKLVVEKD
jgi:DNA sulfur modification protein DndB